MTDQRGTAEGTATRHRRRDDVMNSQAMLDIVRFLMTRPTCDQISQHLVLNLLNAHKPRAAVISLFGVDGSLHAVGAFGMSPQALEAYKTLSLWDSSPMSDAVRSGEPVILDTVEDVQERYPWMGNAETPYEPMAVWPLSLPSQRVGAVQFTFTTSPEEELLRADVTGVSAVLALYLSLLTSIATTPDKAVASLERDDRNGGYPVTGLSLVEGIVPEDGAAHASRRPAPGHPVRSPAAHSRSDGQGPDQLADLQAGGLQRVHGPPGDDGDLPVLRGWGPSRGCSPRRHEGHARRERGVDLPHFWGRARRFFGGRSPMPGHCTLSMGN